MVKCLLSPLNKASRTFTIKPLADILFLTSSCRFLNSIKLIKLKTVCSAVTKVDFPHSLNISLHCLHVYSNYKYTATFGVALSNSLYALFAYILACVWREMKCTSNRGATSDGFCRTVFLFLLFFCYFLSSIRVTSRMSVSLSQFH